MRYVAKIHVLDVMDQIVLSGYVRDCEALDIPERDPLEFTEQVRGRGISDPREWLLTALLEFADRVSRDIARAPGRRPPEGVLYTVSESCDTGQLGLGLTVVGGPGGEEAPVTRSVSGHLRR